MNIIVHLKIAHCAHQLIVGKTDIRLNWLGFLLGNILPDLLWSMSGIAHEVEESLPIVSKIIDEQIICKDTVGDKPAFRQAIQVGIVCHFISDYFCFAHTPKFTRNMLCHYIYEIKMLRYFQKARLFVRETYRTKLIHPAFLQSVLKDRQREYLSEQEHCATDLGYAINFCTDIASSLVEYSKAQQLQTLGITGLAIE